MAILLKTSPVRLPARRTTCSPDAEDGAGGEGLAIVGVELQRVDA